MTRLHEVLAAEKGAKADATKIFTEIHHLVQKAPLLAGSTRVYRPKTENDGTLPTEVVRVQLRANEAIQDVQTALARMLDVVLTHEAANQVAKADIVVPGAGVIASQVPVSYLLFLEKQLTDLRTFIGKLPVLDPSEQWEFDTKTNSWRTPVTETIRTEKRKVVLVKYDATDKHPAQTEVYDKDVPVGTWETVRESGALPQTVVNGMWERASQLLEAVRVARQRANAIEVTDLRAGNALLTYLFRGTESDPGAKR